MKVSKRVRLNARVRDPDGKSRDEITHEITIEGDDRDLLTYDNAFVAINKLLAVELEKAFDQVRSMGGADYQVQTGEVDILNLGLVPGEAYYVASQYLGKPVEDLTEEEKVRAFQIYTMARFYDVDSPKACPDCKGAGYIPNMVDSAAPGVTCSACGGSGLLEVTA